MTFTEDMLPRISGYSVGDTASATVMTSEDFTWYFSVAKKRLDHEKPANVDEVTYDLLHGLLVCHLMYLKTDTGGMQSESIGGYSYSRKADIKAGSSPFESRYTEELGKWQKTGTSSASATLARTDATLPAEFALDDNEIDGSDDGIVNFDGDV